MRKLHLSYGMAGLVILVFAGVAMAQSQDTAATGPIGGPKPTLGTCPCVSGDPEGEVDCGLPFDTFNGGCNSDPIVFSQISCGQTICGTLGAANATRDTDWYELVLPIADTVTIDLTSEVDAVLFTLSMGNPICSNVQLINSDSVVACGGTASIVEAMPAGSNYIFVSTDVIFDGVPCGTEYTLTVSCAIVPVELQGFDID